MSFFEFLNKCPSANSTLGTNTLPEDPGTTVILNLSVFLKKTPTHISESDNILCLGNILRHVRLTYVLVENTLGFSDLTLRYLM